MKTLNELIGNDTYAVFDSPSNRYNCTESPIECTDELIAHLRTGREVELDRLRDSEPDVIEAFENQGIDLSDFTHCIIVGVEDEATRVINYEYYLTWEI